jgi:hypothetical protein
MKDTKPTNPEMNMPDGHSRRGAGALRERWKGGIPVALMTGILSCAGLAVAADGPAAPEASQVAGPGNAVSQNKALNYPTEAKRIPLEMGQVYSGLTWQQARAGVPEIRLLKKTTEAIEYVGPKKHLLDTKEWQESPSRIIYHDGKYHTWVMNIWDVAGGKNPMPPDYGSQFRNFYLTSEDGYKWSVEGLVPHGEKGSFDERWREGPQVVKHDGKFWMFYAGNAATDPTQKQYPKRTGGGTHVGLLVADSPAGPWKRAVEEPLFGRSDDPKDWDFDQANNPYPVYFKGKWFVYYKSRNRTLSGSFDTLQGVAVADKITGPYVKYWNNPVCDGHGSFVWAFRGGIAMQPFGNGGHLIHWSPDGLHWHTVDDPRSRGVATPVLSALYLPHDPLSGEPVTDKEPHIFWGLETDPKKEGGVNRYNMVHSTVEFNEVNRSAGGPAKQDLQFMDVGN